MSNKMYTAFGTNDIDGIWKTNQTLPDAAAECIHDIIARNAARHPGKQAVQAWDGSLSYAELDELSTRLSYKLSELGIGPETIVPLFFEKSMWTVVAVVGVLKAGGAFVLLDMSIPTARLQAVIERCKAEVVCTSSTYAQVCRDMARNVEVVEVASQESFPESHRSASERSKPSPSSPLYVCFTSGSTGLPKGIVITHESFYVAFSHQAHLLGFTPDSRTFDFASYSFDVAVHNVLTTLTIGGCLCIPSDNDRRTNLNKSIRDSKATIVNLTATVARMLEPELLKPHLKTLLLLGEAVNLIDLQKLWGSFKIINTYGPAECTPISTINLTATTPADAVNIGAGVGVRAWIVNPDDHDQLSEYGEVGELLLEGNILARGYLHDPDKTAAAFIENPTWLTQGTVSCPGRTGRLYKTGDLVRYKNLDGEMSFVGRKDTQVKIRGQRMELGEVEHHVRKCLPFSVQLVVDVIEPEGKKDKARLAAFIAKNAENSSQKDAVFANLSGVADGIELAQLQPNIATALTQVLPGYMLPSIYFWIEEIPQTPSGKTDRKRLREIGADLTTQQIVNLQAGPQTEKREPKTLNEILMCKLWSQVIDIEADAIGLDDSFFLLGGDSVAAMKLVSELRKHALDLSVSEIFDNPMLGTLTNLLRDVDSTERTALLPFELLSDFMPEAKLRDELAALCKDLDASLIEDAYPSTALQQGLLSTTASGRTDYTLRAVLKMNENVDITVFQNAWNDTARSLPILRTRLVHHPVSGPVQLVTSAEIRWRVASSLQGYLTSERSTIMEPGSPLCRFGLIEEVDCRYFVLTMHHALYDGWSLPLVLDIAGSFYRQHIGATTTTSTLPAIPFSSFAKHIAMLEKDDAEAYWKSYCADGELTTFPSIPQSLHGVDMTSMTTEMTIKAPADITMSTLLRASLAMLISHYTGSMDIVFGATLSGRNVPVPNIDQVVGPTITTVPIRCLMQRDQTIQSLLKLLQRQSAQMMPHEQTGLQSIAKMGDDCSAACGFQTLLVVQPEENDLKDDIIFGKWQKSSTEEFTAYPITLECLLRAGGVSLRAAYNRAIISDARMERMLQHLANIASQLSNASAGQLVQDVEVITAQDKYTIWNWNLIVPEATERCIHDLISEQAILRPDAPAVHGWDESFTYQELDFLSNRLANHLVKLGVGPEVAVPLFFEKSSWAVVAMLGVLKAGGAFLPLNASEADDRRLYIVQETKATIALASVGNENISLPAHCKLFVVSRESITILSSSVSHLQNPEVSPRGTAYIIFTSGSTGQPKGVVLEHTAVATSCTHHGARFFFNHDTRMLQFSSYTFDASIIEIITTLIHGGCVCVLSESDRLGDLAGAITKMKVNATLLTPTVARMLRPDNVPTLQTLIFGGEAVRQSDYDHWDSLPKLINAYGPTECAVTSVIGLYDRKITLAGSIGTSVGCNTWVADQFDHNRLVPLGAIGELLLEGNILARGYLNNLEKTSSVFIEDPDWMVQGSRHGRLYKTGDLVRQNEDGTISYIGRKDTQVKIRGQRLELSEVEFQMRACVPSMTQIVADIIEPEGKKEKATLAVFFTLHGNEEKNMQILSEVGPGIHTVRVSSHIESELSQKLPRYMIPTVFLLLDEMPLMPSGKTNRKALRSIGTSISAVHFAKFQSQTGANKRQPQNETEIRLRQLWAQVLNIDADGVGIDDSFFHVGGDSITAMQLSALARASIGNISTSEILQQKTISKLASMLLSRVGSLSVSQVATVDHLQRPFNLSPIQHLYSQLEPEPGRCFDQFFFLQLRKTVSLKALSRALETVVSRHSMLRARYGRSSSGQWTQRITNDVSGSIHIGQIDSSNLCQKELAKRIRQSRDLINIEEGPLTSALLLDCEDSQHLFIAIHHFVIDLVSWRILLKELDDTIQLGKTDLPAPQMPFQAWVTAQERYATKNLVNHITVPLNALEYWKVSAGENIEGATLTRQFSIDQDTSNAILGSCNDTFGTRPADLMISALKYSFIGTFSDRTGPSVFTEGHGRETWDEDFDISRTIGWFTAMYPVLTEVDSRSTLFDTIRMVKDATKSVAKNGWEYFTSKFATRESAQLHVKDYPVEVLFNYAGSYQQLERSDSLFMAANIPPGSEASSWSKLRRFCIFEVACQADHGKLEFSVSYPRESNRQGQILDWILSFETTLNELPFHLQNKSREWTLSDYPLTFKAYDDLSQFKENLLPLLDIHGPEDIEDIYPCSAMQEGILVSQGKDTENYRTVLNIECFVSKDEGSIDIFRLEQAWRAVVRRHSLLRAVLVENVPGAKGTTQIILRNPEPSISILSQIDRTTTYSESHNDSAISVSYSPTGLQHHLTLYQVDAENAFLTLEINHAITDGYSVFNILLRDLRLAYNNKLDLNGPAYVDFIKFVATQSAEADLAFWMQQLQGAEPCLISTPSKDSSNLMESFTVALEPIDAAEIHNFCSQWEVSTATVVQTAWAILLQMYTNQAAPTFGMLTSGRNIPIRAVEEIFGPLINIIPCRVDLEADDSIIDVMQRVQKQFIDSYPHQTLPLINIHRALGVGASGLFNTAISFQRNTDQTQHADGGLELRYRDVKDQVEFDISVAADDNTTGLKIQLIFKADFASQEQVQFICNAFKSIIYAILEQPGASPSQMMLLGPTDRMQLRRWNGVAAPSVHMCIHELIGDQVRSQPGAPAVKSWDGELTYSKLDEITNYLALHLRGLGVSTEVVVPLCFEKSMWTVVAWLAVLKAGGAFILLDPSLPDARIQKICGVVNARVAITSPTNSRRFASLVSHVVTLNKDFMASLQSNVVEPLFVDIVSNPGNAAYIIFTSGSTGEPKGAIIEHRSYCSAALGHGSVMNISSSTRSLQFGSYNFAGAIMEMLMVLIYGGCVCILSDEQRSPAKLPDAIQELGANWAFLTSTVLAYMSPAQVPTLKTICVGGEAVRSSQIKDWAASVDLRQTYGSAETSAVVSSALLSPSSTNTHVGNPTTARYWIVNAENSDQLMPIGVPGEILVEGVVIAREYMGNPEKSALTFIQPPSWRLEFGPRNTASRFYKTGDVGVFRENGSLELLGRKDTQVKLRGQRIETGEIEYQARLISPEVEEVAVELAHIGDSKGPELVCFLVIDGVENSNGSFSFEHAGNVKASEIIQRIQSHLEKVLPYFMVPSLLVPITKLPLTVSGKTDRRRLRIFASELPQSQLRYIRSLAEMQTRQPRSKSEKQMRHLWSEVLNLEANRIGLDDSFFRLGGDSVAAMKLVGAARRIGIVLTVADIFRQPSLELQAKDLMTVALELGDSISPFSLLGDEDASGLIRKELAAICRVDASLIQDAYPCTPLQEGLLSLGLKREGDYILQIVTQISAEINVDKLKSAWTKVVDSTPTLRTWFIQHSELGLIQCVMKTSVQFHESRSLDRYLSLDKSKAMGLGEPLLRLALVHDSATGSQYVVSTIHHAIYDGTALYSIIELVSAAYHGKAIDEGEGFRAFVSHVHSADKNATNQFWQTYLSGGEFSTYPELPAKVQEPHPNVFLQREIEIGFKSSFTLSTIIRGAVGIVLSQHSGSEDVVFGALVSGRNAPVPGIESIVGPTIAAVPIRIQINKNETVQTYLNTIQEQSTEMIAYEQTGLPLISRISKSTQRGCNFQTFLEVQPEDDELNLQNEIGTWRTASGQAGFTNYALTLDCLLRSNKVLFKASVDTAVLSQEVVEVILDQFDIVFQGLLQAPESQLIGEIDCLAPSDKTAIWNRCPALPELSPECLHHIITENARTSPEAPAVCGWDGDLTYGELDELSSGLAHHLRSLGVSPGVVVPLFFEKSMWTVVAVVGVLKAGGAFALLDMGLPEARLHSVIQECRANVICSSRSKAHLCSLPSTNVQIIDSDAVKTWSSQQDSPATEHRSSQAMYVCFTSGSTGKPKGIVISHESFATALQYQVNVLGFSSTSRVFDFASYSFDVAVHNVMTTLAVGACLCIPSDDERKNNINGSMNKMRVTMVNLTATVARLLKPEKIPDLKTLILLGEAVNATDLETLWGKFTIINTYGPAECTPISTINLEAETPIAATGIGRASGVLTWVVDPDNHHKLVPSGVVGELLLEGPTLAQGYLHNLEKTAEAFIEDPAWLLHGAPGHAGRRGRLYKTGDLVKYNKDGSLVFIGRKDTQIKIRGQRLELGEIEHHLRECLSYPGQVVVDVIAPDGNNETCMLAVFLSATPGTTTLLGENDANFKSISQVSSGLDYLTVRDDVHNELLLRLPSYMIPSVYFYISSMPQTPSGKTDRKQLRQMGASISMDQMVALRGETNRERRQPETAFEKKLQELWAIILKVDAESIGIDDNFFVLGGDSVYAMKLVAEARKIELSLRVADVFAQPVLKKQAIILANVPNGEMLAPFELLCEQDQKQELCKELTLLCRVQLPALQDAYPCTPLQEGLLSLTAKNAAGYVMQAVLEISVTVNVDALKRAWDDMIRMTPILRTRIVQHSSHGLIQVVINEELQWRSSTDLQKYLAQDRSEHMGLGVPLCRLAIIENEKNPERQLVWTVHHVLYDGSSLPLIMERIARNYHAEEVSLTSPSESSSFGSFVSYIYKQQTAHSNAFWRDYFSNAEYLPFPLLPSSVKEPKPDAILERDLCMNAHTTTTMSSLLRGALSLLIAQFTASKDVVFGAVLSGRNAAVPGIEDMVGPTIATVPLRFRPANNLLVKEYLESIQQDATRMIEFEQTGLQNIAKASTDAANACEFQTLLVVQPEEADLDSTDSLGTWWTSTETAAFTSYAVMIECFLGKDGIKIRTSFDSQIVSEDRMASMITHFGLLAQELAKNPDKTIGDIKILTEKDVAMMWSWNSAVPQLQNTCPHDTFVQQASISPRQPALCGFDGSYTYAQLDDLSSRFANRLSSLQLAKASIVPICIEKSTLAVIAMIGINRAGHAWLPLNPADGSSRHALILEEAAAQLVITSETQSNIQLPSGCNRITISHTSLQQMPLPSIIPPVSPDSPMYVLFTSGSTGKPKGVVVKHRSVSTSLFHHGTRFGFNKNARMLQFSSYTFDAAISEIFGTLVFGGCVCVPSENDRLSNLSGAISSFGVNMSMITPTVARMLEPESVPTLQTLVLCGEAVLESDYQRWISVPAVFNGYGPTESAIYAVVGRYDEIQQHAGCIGKPTGCAAWIVDPEDHNRLSPVGAIGELLLEGWTTAEGYLNNIEKTKEVFVESPAWLQAGGGGLPGRQGRIYKTGDLAYYNTDGTICFIGRKDNQVKIRGQRFELGEVDHHVQTCLPAASQVSALVIMPGGEKHRAMLAVFLTEHESVNDGIITYGSPITVNNMELTHVQVDIQEELAKRLPPYMIPSIYFKMAEMPISTAGKTDRKRLLQIGNGISAQQVARLQADSAKSRTMPETPSELQLQGLWAKALAIGAENIAMEDSFFQLGGDSIAAMKLVGLARAGGIALSVADIFKHPVLQSQTKFTTVADEKMATIGPFSLIPDILAATIREDVSILTALQPGEIEDVYPCTPLQEGLLSLTTKRSGDYTIQAVLEISSDIDLDSFKSAWESIVQSSPILRTRIVQHSTAGLVQVVHNKPIQWSLSADLQSFLKMDSEAAMSLGDDLCRFTLVNEKTGGEDIFVWTVHHALYDGWSLSLVLDAVCDLYICKTQPKVGTAFNSFVKYVLDKQDAAELYWRKYLGSESLGVFPELPSSVREPVANTVLSVDFNFSAGHQTTTATLIRSAVAILISQYTGSQNVVFGATVSGRNVSLPGIGDVVGPTIATVPVRATVDAAQTVADFLNAIQEDALDMVEYEQIGMQRIAKLGSVGRNASNFQTLLVVQPKENDFSDENGLGRWTSSSSQGSFSTYALTLECFMTETGVKIRSSFDASVLPAWQMQYLLSRFGGLLKTLTTARPGKLVGELDILSEGESTLLWQWNKSIPEVVNSSIQDLIASQAQMRGTAQAVAAWDGSLTYQELDDLSSTLAVHLISLGVEANAVLPLCFDRSLWTIVAMLAVNKAGASFVNISYQDSPDRQLYILKETEASIILASQAYESIGSSLGFRTMVISDKTIASLKPISTWTACLLKDRSLPASGTYIIFTSGSTGKPKGVILEHRALVTSCINHGRVYGFNPTSRVLQFSSYTFDACIVEIYTTLVWGGCICVPSETERLSNLAGAFNSLRANVLQITPTVARTIQPASVPELELLILCGEAIAPSDYVQWQHVPRIMNGYGPTEAAICSTVQVYDETSVQNDSIGTAVGCATWVVDQQDHNKLAPIGSIGELLIEGHTVARGYLNNPEKTAEAFITSPKWLLDGSRTCLGRSSRLYKTGDLVRYNANGSLSYIGRKDMQAKLRGQRLELGEVEYQLHRCIQFADHTVAEVINPGGRKDKAMLAAFVTMQAEDSAQAAVFLDAIRVDKGVDLVSVRAQIDAALSQQLPAYMVPTIFFRIDKLPLLPSGKTDRKQLRALGDALTARNLIDLQAKRKGSRRLPESDSQRRLQQLWAQVLNVEADNIGLDDNFFRLGGDSIASMKLVGMSRSEGITLTVADIAKSPVLEDQARSMKASMTMPAAAPVTPFELIDKHERSAVQKDVATMLPSFDIEDIYPTATFQADTIQQSVDCPQQGFNYFYFDIGQEVDVCRLEDSCRAAVDHFAVLRSAFVRCRGRFWQVVLRGLNATLDIIESEQTIAETFDKTCLRDTEVGFLLGRPLTTFWLIQHKTQGSRLVVRLSHSQYDGVSFPIIISALFDHYQSKPLQPAVEFCTYLKYAKTRENSSVSYWKTLLDGAQPTSFPEILSDDVSDCSTDTHRIFVQQSVPLTALPENTTLASITSAAWAVLLASILDSRDVVYGGLVAGRNANFDGIEKVAGPCNNAIPVRARIEPNMTPAALFSSIQRQQLLIGEADSLGLDAIIEKSTAWPREYKFDTIVKHQGIDEDFTFDVHGQPVHVGYFQNPADVPAKYVGIFTYPETNGVMVQIIASSLLMSSDTANWLLERLCCTIQTLVEAKDKPLLVTMNKIASL